MIDADTILAALDEQQREAAVALHGPVCILAGAGTGKTRAITHRIAYGVATGDYDPRRVLALTFTTKAAGEMRTRLAALGADVRARTFHAAALAQLSHFWPRFAGGRMPELLPSKSRTLADAVHQLRLRVESASIRDLASEIEWRKARALTMEQYAVHARTRPLPAGLDAQTVVDVHAAYERLKDERRLIDFEDVLLACTGLLAREPVAAEAVRAQYRHVTIDEFQDVSPLQQLLVDQWLGDRAEVCVVGDQSQAIYAFAGADPTGLAQFTVRHPDATVVRLTHSYRSTTPIVETANRLMRGRGAIELRGTGAGPEPTVSVHASDTAEAIAVAASARALVDEGARPSSIAILTRFHAQSPAFAHALAQHGLSARLAGGRFFDLPVVRQAIAILRSSAPEDRPLFQSVVDVVQPLGLTHEPPSSIGAEREAWDALSAIVTLAEEAPPGTAIDAFGAELARRASTDHAPDVEAVTIATLHAAKGLEWDHVFLVGLSEGLLPISHATSLEAIDEERRLAYVGITRARRTLRLSHARASGRLERSPSRFLAELGTRTPRRPPSASR